LAHRQPGIDQPFAGQQQPQGQKAAGGQDRQQEASVVRDQAHLQEGEAGPQQLGGAGEEGATADDLAYPAQDHEHGGEAEAGDQAIQDRGQGRVFGGEGLGASQDGAVDDDEGDEEAKRLVQLMGIGVETQIDQGHQGGDQDDIDGDAHLRAHDRAHQGHQQVGCC
jgi:hypothetical protein